MLYDWQNMTESQRVKAIESEMKKVTRNATTKDDLVNMLRWLWDKFEVEDSKQKEQTAATRVNERLLRLLELIEIYNNSAGILRAEFEAFAGDEDNPVETIEDLIETMEVEMSYWEE
jgi:hypothetical protein